MRIAFFGAMVNNTYIMARVFQNAGYDVMYIRDPEDTFIPHQPIWVDNRLSLDSKHLWCYSIQECINFEKTQHWTSPRWCINPLDIIKHKSDVSFKHISNFIIRKMSQRRFKRSKWWSESLSLLQQADCIIACGVGPSILARLSGKPYACWSYGGDIRKLMGLEQKPTKLKDRLYNDMTKHLLKDSYENASVVGFNYGEEIYCRGGIENTIEKYQLNNSDIIPFPAFYREITNSDSLERASFQNNSSKIRVLIPSRIDFKIKGHDKLLNAISNLACRKEFTFTVTGWGADQEKFIKALSTKGLNNNVFVMDTMLSRPLLHDLIQSHDIVIDQFNHGMYGTAALEAMSFAKPVMLYLNKNCSGHNEPPPVINCFSEEDILIALQNIMHGNIDIKTLGKQSETWARKYHGNDVFLQSINRYINYFKI